MIAILRPNYSHLKAMMKAIDKARDCGDCKYSKTDGLRAIKRFERVNGISFNPFNKYHIEAISGSAGDERFFRIAGYVLKR